MITFETKQLTGRRKVKIDGHPYIVRRMGNIENLEYSRAVRKLQALAAHEATRDLTAKELAEVESISTKLADMMVALFDDGGDQSMSRKLVSSLSEGEISELLAMAFAVPEETKKDVPAKA